MDSILGRALGWAIAPAFGLVSFARHARTFHPRGTTFHARVSVHQGVESELRNLATRLAGPALVRFSGALWKNAENRIDVLGCAIRFRRDARARAEADEDDQDILFATIRRPWTMAFAPLTTKVDDYLSNDYFAVSPFDVGLDRRVYLQLHPCVPSSLGGTRTERLEREVANHPVDLVLSLASRPFGPWRPFANIELVRVAAVDGEALRFRPYRTGRGVRPRGFIHALRRGVYVSSQRARPDDALSR